MLLHLFFKAIIYFWFANFCLAVTPEEKINILGLKFSNTAILHDYANSPAFDLCTKASLFEKDGNLDEAIVCWLSALGAVLAHGKRIGYVFPTDIKIDALEDTGFFTAGRELLSFIALSAGNIYLKKHVDNLNITEQCDNYLQGAYYFYHAGRLLFPDVKKPKAISFGIASPSMRDIDIAFDAYAKAMGCVAAFKDYFSKNSDFVSVELLKKYEQLLQIEKSILSMISSLKTDDKSLYELGLKRCSVFLDLEQVKKKQRMSDQAVQFDSSDAGNCVWEVVNHTQDPEQQKNLRRFRQALYFQASDSARGEYWKLNGREMAASIYGPPLSCEQEDLLAAELASILSSAVDRLPVGNACDVLRKAQNFLSSVPDMIARGDQDFCSASHVKELLDTCVDLYSLCRKDQTLMSDYSQYLNVGCSLAEWLYKLSAKHYQIGLVLMIWFLEKKLSCCPALDLDGKCEIRLAKLYFLTQIPSVLDNSMVLLLRAIGPKQAEDATQARAEESKESLVYFSWKNRLEMWGALLTESRWNSIDKSRDFLEKALLFMAPEKIVTTGMGSSSADKNQQEKRKKIEKLIGTFQAAINNREEWYKSLTCWNYVVSDEI